MKNDTLKNILIGVLLVIIILLVAVIYFVYTGKLEIDSVDNFSNQNSDVVENVKLSEDEAIAVGKGLYDKATEIYETWQLLPYCGVAMDDTYYQKMYYLGDNDGVGGTYYKTNFKDLEQLTNYLSNWLSEDIVSDKMGDDVVTDLTLLGTEGYEYVNYVIKDDALYCRQHTGKGWLSNYVDYYDMSVDSVDENKIVYNIKSYYVSNDSECRSDENMIVSVNSCDEEDITTKDTKFVIEKNDDNNWVVSEYNLHE